MKMSLLNMQWKELSKEMPMPHIVKTQRFNYDWDIVSSRSDFDFDLKWDWDVLSKSLPVSFIVKNLKPNFNWDILSDRLPMSFITENPELKWGWEIVSGNKSLRISHLIDHLEHPWMWDVVTRNSGISMENVLQNQETIPWDFTCLYANPNVKRRDILGNPDLNWRLDLWEQWFPKF